MKQGEWVRSSKCGTNGACAEVMAPGNGWDFVRIRSSDEPGNYVVFSEDEWAAFVAGVKNGEFDPEPQ